MSLPPLKLEAAIGGEAFAENVWLIGVEGFSEIGVTTFVNDGPATFTEWVEVTDRIRSQGGIDWAYGRSSELDRPESGRGNTVLDNRDRAFDPTNDQSPWWPDIRPMTRIRLSAELEATSHRIFDGYVASWGPRWRAASESTVRTRLVDQLAPLALTPAEGVFAQATTGQRIRDVLDGAGWPQSRRVIGDGQSIVQEAPATQGRMAIDLIRDAADAEFGVLFASGEGDIVFRDRIDRFTTEVAATFGDGPGELPYADLIPEDDDSQLFNDIVIAPDGLDSQSAVDTGSVAKFGRRRLPRNPGRRLADEETAQQMAQGLKVRHASPTVRFEQIALAAHADVAVLTQAVTRRPGDRIKVIARPPGGGDPLVSEQIIERVAHEIAQGRWITRWRLSPAEVQDFWLVGVVGRSEIGVTTRVGW